MNQNQKKLTFITLAVTLTACSLILFQFAQAQNSQPTQEPVAPAEINNACEPQIKEKASLQLQDFRTFLSVNFQNKSSTDSLAEKGISKYREMRRELMDAYEKYNPNQGSTQFITGLQPAACFAIVRETLEDARNLLRIHASRTSGVKKSAALLEKYQAINNQLQGLSQQFTALRGYLDAFAAKLPCYVQKGACLKG
jgi:hypothetical protein